MPSSSTTDSILVDRTEEAEKASSGLLRFLQNGNGTRLVQIYGLPLVGKSTLGKQICCIVEKQCTKNDIRLNFTHVYYEDSIHSYVVKSIKSTKLTVLEKLEDLQRCVLNFSAGKYLSFLDDFPHPDWISSLLENGNFCCVLTSKRKLDFLRLGTQVYHKNLSTLTAEESTNFMMEHLQPEEWTYQLSKTSENCQGFPRLLSQVTEFLKSHPPREIYQLSFESLCSKFLSENESFRYRSKLDRQVQKVGNAVPAVYVPSLAIMRGSFRIPDLAAVSNISKEEVVTKRILIEPLIQFGIISRSEAKVGSKFVVNDIICSLLEDRYGYLQNESDLHNRFCNYFAKMFSDLERKMITDVDDFFSIFLGMYPNLLALVERAVYCLKEEYDVLIRVAYQAELIMMSFLQAKEVVTFFEACVQAAKERGNMTDYARMLSSYGHSLLVICPDVDFGGEKILEALELMRKDPNILETEIALTTSHKGHYLHLKGNPAAGIKCYEKAVSIYVKCLEEAGPPQTDLDAARLKFLKYSKVRMKNNIAISAGCLGQYDYSIKLHQENITTYQEMFSSNLGMGKAYHCIGLMLHLKGDQKAAHKYSKIGLTIKRRSHSKKPSLSIIYSMSLQAMSYFYTEEQDAERSLLILDDAIAMIDDLKRNHADRSLLLNGKGIIHLKTKNYRMARDLLDEAAEIRIKEFGIGANCSSGESLQFLGEAYFHLKEHWKAVATFKKCLALRLEYYRKQFPDNFEEIILTTVEWLERSLIEYEAESSVVEFVADFAVKLKAVLQHRKCQDSVSLASAKDELKCTIEKAFSRLDLKVPDSVTTN